MLSPSKVVLREGSERFDRNCVRNFLFTGKTSFEIISLSPRNFLFTVKETCFSVSPSSLVLECSFFGLVQSLSFLTGSVLEFRVSGTSVA